MSGNHQPPSALKEVLRVELVSFALIYKLLPTVITAIPGERDMFEPACTKHLAHTVDD